MNIGIIIDMENGRVKDADFGMITLARQTGDAVLYALVPDAADTAAAETLSSYGIDVIAEIVLPEDPGIRLNPDVRARALTAAARELALDMIFGLSTAEGRDLIPRVAAIIDAPLVMDCTDVKPVEKIARTSQYSGKVTADIRVTGDCPVFGIRPNSAAPVLSPREARPVSVDCTALTSSGLTLTAWDEAAADGELPSLAEADIIVAGGRGMQGSENFSLLFDCAKKLNAAVGASRAAVDEGWIPYAHQVGQTGEKVSPSIYLAFGISGSVQHFAGMKTSGTIIAVNTDENAAMMANADYYINADLFEILPELIRQLDE